MSDLNREQFEEWHRSVVDGEPPHEKYSDGSYINPHVNRYWTGWQASRECLVIELPNRFDEKYQDYYDDVEGGCFNECRYINDVHAALTAAGVKYK